MKYTGPAEGPEFPAKSYAGIGFDGADHNDSYKYHKTVCTGTGADRDCEYEDRTAAGDALIRVTDKYILYKKSDSYRYCWF